jgi:peptide/nickel transport system substrate-binding protein
LKLLQIAASVAAGLLLSACTQAQPPPQPQTHILRVGIQATPLTLNALLSNNTTEAMIDRLIFDGLVTIDASGRKQIPVLAAEVPTLANGGISKDGLTVTYKLRHNVHWHDGVLFTSRDVKFTWAAVLNPNNNVITHSGYELVRSVDTPDPYTVVFHFKQKYAPAVNTLFGESDDPYEIVPAHILEKYHDINQIPFNSAPVGTGPFTFKEWLRGDHIELVANDRYFLGAPKLRSIDIRIVPDENTEVNLLRTHDIDWQFEASESEYHTLKAIPDLRIVLQVRNQFERIEIMTKHPPLDDVRVRRAIAYAMDTPRLVHDLTAGTAVVADQDLPPFMWAHSTSVHRYPHNVALARRLLAQAGWTAGPDGIMQKGGQRLSLDLAYNSSNATRRRGTVELQSMLRAAGIDTQLKSYLGTILFATMGQGGILQNGKFDLAWTGWVSGVDPDNANLFACWAQPPNGQNEARFCDPDVDAAETRALTNFDQTTRKAAYAALEERVTDQVPDIFIWWQRQIQPISPAFKNFTPNPVTASWNAYQWDI